MLQSFKERIQEFLRRLKSANGLLNQAGSDGTRLGSRPERRSDGAMRSVLGRLILIRVLVLTVILGIASWDMLTSAPSEPGSSNVFWAVGTIYFLSALNALMLQRAKQLSRFGYAQLGLDVVLASVAM